jgi:kynurenine formamidase
MAAQADLDALRLATTGRIYDLSSGWWRHMPVPDSHPQLEVLTYRSPRGLKNQNDLPIFGREDNATNTGMISDLLMGSTHSGTHIDALAHATCGPHHQWHGGHAADAMLGDFGPLAEDASALGPIVARGVLVDVPALLEVPALAPAQPIGVAEIEGALERQKTEVRPGDVFLVRTGQMRYWPDVGEMEQVDGAGLAIDGARWASERGVRAVGGDTLALELLPSGLPGDPLPVHWHLLGESGIPILEWVNCEELSRDGVYEFLFIALPLNVHGATASMLRPIAIT